jgi:hypothetical protein
LRIRVQSCAKATITENHAALPREVEVEARADAALIKGLYLRRTVENVIAVAGTRPRPSIAAVSNALHWELHGQAALIVTGNHT